MKTIRMTFLLILSLLSKSVFSTELNVEGGYGINILVVNGTEVKNNKIAQLVKGENQVIVSYSGKLKSSSGGKSEYYRSVPYINVIEVGNDSKIKVEIKSKRVKEAKKLEKDGGLLFQFFDNGKPIQSVQQVLPAEGGFMPYGDILSLVKGYNLDNGLIYENGKIRALKAELANIQPQLAGDTEVTLQLKLWFTRASDEERKEFRKWMIDQE